MMREFSVIRRRPNLLDIITPILDGVDGYRIEGASNFDAAFATLATSTRDGYTDESLRDLVHAALAGKNVRIILNPSDHGLTDTKAFWLRFVPLTGGVPGTVGNRTLILPEASGRGLVSITGTAPIGATVANAIALDFPRLMEDLRIVNNSAGNSLFVSFSDSDAEYEIKPGATQVPLANLRGSVSGIRVRGGGAAVAFQATCTLAFAR